MTEKISKKYSTIAIIGAMEQEIELLKHSMENVESMQFGHFTVHHGSLSDKKIILALSGIGKVNAAAITALVISRFCPDCIINTGSAGGLGQGLKVGDVVIGERVAHHDVDVTAFGYVLGQVPKLGVSFETDSKLLEVASQAATAFQGATVHRGLIVSGDQFVHSTEKVEYIRTHFKEVLAVEMEAAAIAQTCHQLAIPFVVIRAISDLANEKASMSFEEFLQVASGNSAKMVMKIIDLL
ncbi:MULTISPECIES: 5'-methylthioadenosine/adenosylhomocysteine nucleosidase [unclassified Neisseria]|uniref:5'-methylthioadenosine/adenosylhomocysteine nucleosidase n=1 Tax=unclassified Neisseria TaxID=2623750 RepID=UPI002666101B|nr:MULTISPECIES: 5'-methylthioadenosine/adenosylhomocysteine nucleosidase [unclassified Neisseria]MDO1509564.1 5'-methylthioadenosine/adenosylhomocysteine nucleosidase [Neisseria sp. MVDL19-042950]MDO1515664.1 5'-methylthioadenosine/adenosylhomocysteine nucleosidase [Neisseria sp. MVDL18-041461]MDO1563513.1 5'-methylthioadenosine/adenosylhomocysteine nucleosidase [Neisseria sp. MVDL20-010259]